MATGFLYDTRYLEHHTGPGHPECPERLEATLAYLERLPWFSQLTSLEPRAAELDWINTIHSLEYIRHAEAACQHEEPMLDTPDVGISRKSFDIARLATGGALAMADAVLEGKIRNGFALLRPPGHHAESDQAMGFCLFNNIAILSRYLQKKHNLDKIAIVDWDVHHGNGTQHSFEEDPSVLYVSLHQFPFYPGTGRSSETGTGRGRGATLNCPMTAGSGDSHYREAFQRDILPAVDAFRPEAVLISAGFDAHRLDPLANINLSAEIFGWMTERLMEIADRHAGGKMIALLEGGYHLEALPRCVEQHLATLSGNLS